MQTSRKRNTGPVAFGVTLLLIFIFAVAAFNRYEKGGEPQAPLFPSDHSARSEAVSATAQTPGNSSQDNPLTTTVKALVEEQQAMQTPADDKTNPMTKARQLVERAERLIDGEREPTAPAVQPATKPIDIENNTAYQRRTVEIERLRQRLAEMQTKP